MNPSGALPRLRIPAILFAFSLCFLIEYAVLPGQAGAVLGIHIRNVSIGGGVNAAWKEADYPEVPFYYESDLKKTFLIDIRLDIAAWSEKWRFVPELSYWNWGSFPKQGTNGVESQLLSFDFNLGVQRLFERRGKWRPYAGAGLGLYISRHRTDFPLDFFKNHALIVYEITEKTLKVGPNVAIGNDFFIFPKIAFFQELRFELASGLRQVRFIIGINTF